MIKFQARTEPGWTVDSPLQPVQFPDGAAHMTGEDAASSFKFQIADVRGMSNDDLFTLAMWAKACDARDEKKVLLLPYLPGARMDRGAVVGANVYSEFIGEFVNPDQTITIDPHSEAAYGLYDNSLRNLSVFPVERIIKREVQDGSSDSRAHEYVGVIAPDKGAHARASAAAKVMGVPVYQAGKTRDFATGKLAGFHIEDALPETGKLLLVDDICDGGGTFLGLADEIGLGRDRLDLWVTHGIFSQGLSNLLRRFDKIHTTDSFMTTNSVYYPSRSAGTHVVDQKRVKVHSLTAYLYGEIKL